jgi:DNA repair exonuclease SbcCD ATPase subunit
MFPLDYVQQLRQEAANYRTKLKEQEQAQAKQREAELAKKQEWEQLAEERAKQLAELEPIKTAYEQMLETLKASNAKRIESVPEDKRSLIPEYDDPSKLAAWLDANAALLSMKPVAPNINGAAGSGQRPGAALPVLSDEELAVAKKMGLTPEQYAESKKKIKER